MGTRIDLNADLGEYDDAQSIARDTALMRHISSCNIACGGHAGTPRLMETMLCAAQAAGIAAGAHPSYPDRANFGRRTIAIEADKLCSALIAQVEALQDIAARIGITLTHIKPHGALYNDLADDAALADAVCGCLHDRFPDLALVGLAGGAMQRAASKAGAVYIAEAFIDRQYTPQKRLTPRGQPGAVLDDDADRVAQAVMFAVEGIVRAGTGEHVAISAQSLCIHSDSEGALDTAKAVRAALQDAGVTIAAIR